MQLIITPSATVLSSREQLYNVQINDSCVYANATLQISRRIAAAFALRGYSVAMGQ